MIADYAVEPLAAARLYVTNGEVVMRSTDSGCHWTASYSLPASGLLSASNARILEIEVSAPGTVYLPIQITEPNPRPQVVVTRDAGVTWTAGDGPVLNALFGRIRDLDASLGNGAAAAMLIDVELSEPGVVGAEGQQALLTTATAGETWEVGQVLVSDSSVITPAGPFNVTSGPEYIAVAMNPVRPNEVWLYGPEGAATFDGATVADVGLGPTRVLDVAMDGTAVVAYGPEGGTGNVSLDSGVSFSPLRSGIPVDSMDVVLSTPIEIATGALGRVFAQYLMPGQNLPLLFDISPLDGRALSDVQVAFPESTQRPSVYARTATTIEVKYEPKGEQVTPDQVFGSLKAPPDLGHNNLRPASKRLELRPGDTKAIPYDANLPAAATPLDVYFMIDISGSMQGTIDGISVAMQEIVDRLNADGTDVHFGVGSFRSYDTPPAYARNRDIGIPNNELASALNSLRASGGGDESQMAALLQSVTGEGDAGIAPGLDMHFRPGSLRVAIEVTDEPISQGGPHPTLDQVTRALVQHDVKQVGLAIQPPPLIGEHNYDNPGDPARSLGVVAKGSGALAPTAGVDCDGDGEPEIDYGEPIVCLIDPNKVEDAKYMAEAIVNVLDAIQDVQSLVPAVSPKADPSATSPIVESIVPATLPAIDLKKGGTLAFEVTVRCPHVPARTTFPTRVSVGRSGSTIAEASLEVVCVPLIKKPDPVPLFAAFVPLAAVPPPPPRPPDPVPEPNPNPNPQPQQNPQAQHGFAAQEQQQPQVALAGQEGAVNNPAAEEAADEFYMSRHNESRVPPVGFIFTAAAMTSVGGYLLVTQRRTRTAQVGNRRSRRR